MVLKYIQAGKRQVPLFTSDSLHLKANPCQCKDKVSRFPGAVHKSFRSRKEAQDWLACGWIFTATLLDFEFEHGLPHSKASASTSGSGPQTPIVISDDEDGLPKPSRKPTPIIVLDDDDEPPSAAKNSHVAAEPAALDPVPPKPKTAIVLSPEQQTVLNAVRAEKNVFFTGSAGTGKSVLLREIIDHCGGRESETLAITATTGIAAVGAQVMLIKNLVQGQLVNGSIGKVVKFSTLSELAQDDPAMGEEKDGVFRPDSNRSSLPSRAWPVVKFINGVERVITPADFEINNAEGKMEARRVQVPLILAWALSVHKSQGQTLERVKVDLRRTFEKGQAYVAISRATTLEHLQILNFEPTKDDDGFDDEMDCEDAIRYYHDF
ncbi:hypothetical protein EST38_g2009 [Candolleomyces aberdarensis]|uniref:ATP-dependent DNA helicase n=1 Tax=Candolleomyces aberdarensis TaxID=2316362 RepID=A0A4Q2DW05_9AGAR|nr:hypothetical protein EST38_g2009 [Candolleomyces aberdarensis]